MTSYLHSNRNNRKKGFGAAIALMLLSLTSLALMLAVLGAAVMAQDIVFRKEVRLQRSLNEKTCADTATLMKAKDVFASGQFYIRDFDCSVTL